MYLGIDIGTSSVKTVLMDASNRAIASANAALSIQHPKPLYAEQNPSDWWQATQTCLMTLKQEHSKLLQAIQAIGLTGQQHGAVLLDKQHQVLRPAILWNDGRAMPQCKTMHQTLPEITNITGNLVMPGFTAPKLLWIKEHEPHHFKAINRVLLPKDYIRYQLTGDFATDCSDASGTAWLDVKARKWSDTLLALTYLDQSHMPKLYEGNQITGSISKALATKWGIPANTPVIAGGGDNAISAIAMNIIHKGEAFLSLGTSGVLFVADDDYHTNPKAAVHTMCHCLPNTWHQMAVHLNATSPLSWLTRILQQPITTLIEKAQQKKTQTELLFLPYFNGERTPHNNPYACGMFFGLKEQHDDADLTQAVLEGVAMAIALGHRAILEAKTNINNIDVIGGGSNSLYWGNILANVLNTPLTYRQDRTVSAALGAAKLAAACQQQNTNAFAFTRSASEILVEPTPTRVRYYQNKQVLFSSLYKTNLSLYETYFHYQEGQQS